MPELSPEEGAGVYHRAKVYTRVEEIGCAKRGITGLLKWMQKKEGKQSTRSRRDSEWIQKSSPSSRNTDIASGLRAHSCISVPTTMSGTWQEPNKHWPRSHPRHQKPTWRAFENPQRIRGLRDKLRSTSPHSLVEYQKKKKAHMSRGTQDHFSPCED